jgi:RNA polymerase sigma factor (sigma-70 family)
LGGGLGSTRPDLGVLFTSTYRQHSSAVFGYLRAQGVEDPESVTQDVFLALYPRLAAIRGGAVGVRTLIFSIAHARVVDHYRYRRRTPALLEYDPANDTRTTGSAEDRALGGNTAALALLVNLTADHREVLALRIIADLSLEVTAQIMGKTPGAIKQLQRRALAALKDELAMQVESTP